jgi:hypothetical protein
VHLPMSVPEGDWSQRALLDMRDEVSFNLFDQTRKTEGDAREANVRIQRDERRWLGGFSLPFSTLYRNGKVAARPLPLPCSPHRLPRPPHPPHHALLATCSFTRAANYLLTTTHDLLHYYY